MVARYAYEPFGSLTAASGLVDGELHRFTGKPSDLETSLSYFNARYYDPAIGRFTSSDPARDGLNWFVYCSGDPIVFIDQNGKTTLSVSINAYAQALIRFSLSLGFAIDSNLNARFLAAPAIGGGTPMVGCALNISITNANSVEELENIGIEAGGSMNWSYFGIGCPIGGVEFISGIREDGSNWVGINFSVMDLGKLVAQIASLGMLIPVEMHGEASCTYLGDIPEWLEGGVIRLVKFIAKEALLNMPLESRMLFTKQMGISIEDFINEQKNW